MAEPVIKPDPDAPGASPANFEEDDIYEDAGDLEFNTDPKFQTLYLARVPKYLWEAWSKLDDDAEIRIGTIRQTSEVTPDGQQKVCCCEFQDIHITHRSTDFTIHAFVARNSCAPNGSQRICVGCDRGIR